MNIENDIFKKSKANIKELEKYGFIEEKEFFIYEKNIMYNSMKVIITILKDSNKVIGKIIDNSFGDEYTIFRLENQSGSFIGNVRKEFENLLIDIKNKCFIDEFFIFEQSNRITKMIKNTFGDDPNFEWEKFEDYATFRNSSSKKWYGIIMNVDRNRIYDAEGEVEIINVKLPENKIKKLLSKEGYYPAYHMNKKYWVSIVLDDTLKDDEIFSLIRESHELTEAEKKSMEWIVPANPKYFDVCKAFDSKDINLWKQSTNINVGDIVYIYVGSPISAIMYRCEVLKTNIPYISKNVNMTHAMEVKVLNRFKKTDYPFSKIKLLGIPSIRGPRHISENLSIDIKNFVKNYRSQA